jgi:protein TonB
MYFGDPAPRGGPGAGTVSALAVALAVHAGLGAYLWQSNFEPRFREFAEEVTEVQLVTPSPPAPPPPPEPEAARPPKPRASPSIQARPPKAAIPVAAVPPLPIAPVAERVESISLPVIAQEIAPPTLPGPASAPPAPPAPPVITNPDWLQQPSAAEISRYYPDRAARLGVEGRALITCRVSAEGRLEACAVSHESPEEAGFGQAAVKMSRHFKMRPMTRDGVAVSSGTISIPIRFTLPA